MIKKLSSLPVEAGQPILSIYLQAHGQEPAQRKRVRVFLDRVLRSKELTELAASNRQWHDKIRSIKAQADSFLNDKEKGCFHGIAFFAASSEPSVLTYASYLPLPNDYYLMNLPALGPLVCLKDDYVPLCMCVFSHEEAHILELKDGILSEAQELEQEVYPHHKQGGWAQARFQRKHEEDVDQFFRQIVRRLEQVAIQNPEMKFALLGQRSELPMLRKVLPDQVRRRLIAEEVIKTGIDSGRMIQKGLEILERYERAQKHEDIEKLTFGRISQGYGTVTPEKVFRAINQGQVNTLFLRRNLDESGAIVLSTHTILDTYRQQSPYDGDPVSVAPLREILVYETIRHNGRIQWLPPATNGQTPRFGVLYRNRGQMDSAQD